MEITFELIADICADIAIALLLWRLVSKKGSISCARLISVTFGIGFVIGTVATGICGTNVFIIPNVLGAILSCMAFLFTFPGRKRKSEVEGK